MDCHLEEFLKKYSVEEKRLKIEKNEFVFFLPTDLTPFIKDESISDFPLWAKVWEGSIVLISHIYELNLATPKSFLEIGAGIGVVGVIIASLGHRVTITDYNEDALQFALANVCKNLNPEKKRSVIVKRCDWKDPQLQEETYDFIVGSDILYREEDFEPLLKLFNRHLKQTGEVILAEGIRKTSLKFLNELSKEYKVNVAKKVLRSSKEELPVILIKAKRK